jgi:integrase
MPLSDAAVRAAKPGATLTKISDGKGLQLWLHPSGSKIWNLAYRYHGKQRKLTIGPYPEISLADARVKRDEARRLMLLEDVDPNENKRQKRREKVLADSSSFDVIADEFIAKKEAEGKAETTLVKIRWLLDFARPVLGRRPVKDILAPEVLDVIRPVERKGRHETAHRLRSILGEVFRYAIATGRAVNDPTHALRGALIAKRPQHRAAITESDGFGALLRAIDGFEGQPTTVAALKLMALLFPRPGELRQALWKEFDFDRAVWTIPATRTKMRRLHKVPLSRQSIAILTELRQVMRPSELVFPSITTVRRPISENTLNGALRRLGYGPDEMTAHGFRAAASTLLNESRKWSHDAIERALGHQDPNEIRRAYARGEYWSERVEMAQWWADYVDELKG